MTPGPLECHWSGGDTRGGDLPREVRVLSEGPGAVRGLALPLTREMPATSTSPAWSSAKDETSRLRSAPSAQGPWAGPRGIQALPRLCYVATILAAQKGKQAWGAKGTSNIPPDPSTERGSGLRPRPKRRGRRAESGLRDVQPPLRHLLLVHLGRRVLLFVLVSSSTKPGATAFSQATTSRTCSCACLGLRGRGGLQ